MKLVHPRMTTLRRAFGLVEVTLSLLLVGLLLSVSMRTFGQMTGTQRFGHETHLAEQMALDLLNEIMAKPFKDPDGTVNVLGIEVNEILGGPRNGYDDVDDYHGYQESPLKDRAGNVIAGTSVYSRRVTVQFCDPVNTPNVVLTQTKLKLITVKVEINGYEVATVFGLRADVDSQMN